MAYISNELTHFVGRSLSTDQLRYELLSKIIRAGELIDPSHIDREDPIFCVRMVPDSEELTNLSQYRGVDYSSYPNVRHDVQSKLSDNGLLRFEIVCFCDIPVEELAIHCSKYSYFGVSFSKSFLVKQGASPVMYIPRIGSFEMVIRERDLNSGKQFEEKRCVGDRANLIDATFAFHNELCMKRFRELQDRMGKVFQQSETFDEGKIVADDLWATLFYQTGIEAYLFSHLKFFDPTLSPDDPDNYYMEREWRVSGKVRFSLTDIESLYVPAEFIELARGDFPVLEARVKTLIPSKK